MQHFLQSTVSLEDASTDYTRQHGVSTVWQGLNGGPCLFAGWWYRPEFIINELNINATITSPAHDESVPLTPQPYTLRGYAYSGEPASPCAPPCRCCLLAINK